MFWPFDIPYTLLGENSGHTHLDLFFIGPFYHQLLPHLDQVIVVDLDLELGRAKVLVDGGFRRGAGLTLLACLPHRNSIAAE